MTTEITHNTPVVTEAGRVGFLGCGQMGRALLAGWIERGRVLPEQVVVADKVTAEDTARRFGVRATSAAGVVAEADVVLLAVKPAQAVPLLSALKFNREQVLVSVAAGVSQATLQAVVSPARVIRTMPNTPAQVGAGVTLLLDGPEDLPADVALVERLFSAVGHVERVAREELFHAGTALTGSGPAYLFMLMEALADGAVAAGMPREQARRLSALTVAGAGALASAPGAHPAVLKDAVTSPAGTTAAGLSVLEDRAVRGAFIAAVKAAARRSCELAGEGC